MSPIQCAGEVHALAAATLAEVEDAAQTVAEKVARVHKILLPGSHAHDHAQEAVERIVANGLTRALRGEAAGATR
ncbi:hypothetical protein [Microbacterium sp. Bi121]|uniref:hypothetical protein n=1 Tax=Microbacterium sp. Bi121 TaxID=2822348 RepID=UPI001D4A0BE0|nr:hypothetical protein [Microbacterium sp. Bi121]CAH0207431.1 hypothetical protein SRABI121_02639 [Microbacterium sp. Bi121]